jgi:dihydroneopterin aldolase
MDTNTLLRVIDMLSDNIKCLNLEGEKNSLDASDCGRLVAYENMRDSLQQWVKNMDTELYKTLAQEELIGVRLTWEELTAVLSAVKYVKAQVDSDKLDTAYVRLSTQYRGV